MLSERPDGGDPAGRDDDCVYLVTNAHWEGHPVELPALPPELAWYRAADTAVPAPADAYRPGTEPVLADQRGLFVSPRSTVVLVARPPQPEQP
jgi:isoamylase